MKFATVFICVALLCSGTAHAADNIFARTVGQHGFMANDWYICPSWDVYKKFRNLLKLPGEDAQAGFVLADRDCIKVRDQTEVVVEDTNFL